MVLSNLRVVLLSRLACLFPGVFNELHVEPVEVGKSAVPAPDREIPAADRGIMRAGHLAVPAQCCRQEAPDIITSWLDKIPLVTDIFNNRDIRPRSPAVITHDLCTVRDCGNDLVDMFLAVVTGSPVTERYEIFHVSYSRTGQDKVLLNKATVDPLSTSVVSDNQPVSMLLIRQLPGKNCIKGSHQL
jgi:hypothetical protein